MGSFKFDDPVPRSTPATKEELPTRKAPSSSPFTSLRSVFIIIMAHVDDRGGGDILVGDRDIMFIYTGGRVPENLREIITHAIIDKSIYASNERTSLLPSVAVVLADMGMLLSELR